VTNHYKFGGFKLIQIYYLIVLEVRSPKMGLTGLKSRRWQSRASPGGPKGEGVPAEPLDGVCLPATLQFHCHFSPPMSSWLWRPELLLQRLLGWHMPSTHPLFRRMQIFPNLKILTIPTCSLSCYRRQHTHRFWGLGTTPAWQINVVIGPGKQKAGNLSG
jgi:hypothetical protein